MRQCKGAAPAINLILIFYLVCPCFCSAQGLQVFRIGTGGKTGVYYPIGKLIAEGVTCQFPGNGSSSSREKSNDRSFIAVAQNSAGSVENASAVLCGETEAGMVQADVAFQAYTSSGPFDGNPESGEIRAIASLYPENFQIVVRKDAGIQKIEDLKGKRISLDEQGSGTLSVMRIVLSACRMSEQDLMPVYLKPVFTKDKMISGELQGFVMMAGLPMEAVLNLIPTGISLISVPETVAWKINSLYPHLFPGVIPANIYPGVPETQTVQVYAILAVCSHTDPDLIYKITAALWSDPVRSLLQKGHPQAREITLKKALTGLTIPLHKGAERFYRKMGMLNQGTSLP